MSIIHDVQGYAKTAEDAVADVLKAGMNLHITASNTCPLYIYWSESPNCPITLSEMG